MKTSNFRIGNLVSAIYEDEDGKSSSTICRITAIDEHGNLGDGWEFMFESIDGDSHDVYDDSFPIQLTEEWLIRFGFECIGKGTDYEIFCIGYEVDDSHEGIGSYDCAIELNKNDDGSFHLELSSVEIYHVHQLQNLVFALTGNELELVKK